MQMSGHAFFGVWERAFCCSRAFGGLCNDGSKSGRWVGFSIVSTAIGISVGEYVNTTRVCLPKGVRLWLICHLEISLIFLINGIIHLWVINFFLIQKMG